MKRVRKRLLLTVCAMVLPLAVTLIIYNIYSMTALNRQAAQSAAGTGYIYEQFYEKSIKTVQSYMISEMVGNDFRRLNYPLESLQAYLCGQNILEDFTKYLTSDVDGLVALEFYSESNDLLRIKHAPGTRYVPTKQSGICRAVYEEMKQGELNSDWYVIPVGDDYFLIRILKYGSMYIGAVMDFDQFMKPSSEVEGRSSYLVYATQDGQALNQKNLVQYYISPYGSFWNYMGTLQWFLLFCSFIFILLIPILYFYMYRFFVAPLEGLKATMEEIAEGDLNAYAEENSDVEEFRLMATTFNHMMDQIQKLKIDAYEQERRIQNATIQYLQIQIRPHFFLNCLKNFYALAEQKEYRSIQELTLALSSYLRKVITYEEDTISVRKEMESVESYLKLSQLGLSVPVNYNIAVDEKLEEFQILPLSVLTFVENAVKYGVQSQKTLLISIRVSLLPGETPEDTYVCITILDNGPGFPEELLHFLNKEEFAEEKTAGIGIQNVWKRIKIRYEEKATILYSNSNGACVEMYLPYEKY